jgi:hypothetical protein
MLAGKDWKDFQSCLIVYTDIHKTPSNLSPYTRNPGVTTEKPVYPNAPLPKSPYTEKPIYPKAVHKSSFRVNNPFLTPFGAHNPKDPAKMGVIGN